MFAHLTGTIKLLAQTERDRIIGTVINCFRGDISLLEPGIDWLEDYSAKPIFGTLPYLHGLHLESEDSVVIPQLDNPTADKQLTIVVRIVTRMSNHTDLDALRLHP